MPSIPACQRTPRPTVARRLVPLLALVVLGAGAPGLCAEGNGSAATAAKRLEERLAAVKGVEDRPDKSPDGVGAESDDHRDQQDSAHGPAGEDDEGAGLVGRGAAQPQGKAHGEGAHRGVQHAPNYVPGPLEELEPGIGGAAFGRGSGPACRAVDACHRATSTPGSVTGLGTWVR